MLWGMRLLLGKEFGWYNQFNNGREDIFDDKRSGRPKKFSEQRNIILVQELIMEESFSQRY
jgi:transposase